MLFQRYCQFCNPARHLFPRSHPTSSSLPQISPCSPGSRWMAFGLRTYEERRCWANWPCN